MRRVVVTGIGIASPLGLDKQTVLDSLRAGRSGVVYRPEYEAQGLRSHVAGAVDVDFAEHIDRKHLRFMSAAAAYGYLAMRSAIADAGLEDDEVSNLRSGIIMGAGG